MKSLGVGVVGTGWVSDEHIKAFQQNPHSEVRGIASRVKERARAKAGQHGLRGAAAYDDLRGLLDDKNIHIISICTPHHLHAEQGIAAARAGRHILMEKPMALDLGSLHALDAAVRQAGVRTVVSFVLRWNPLFDIIKAQLAERLIGNLYYAEVDYMHGIGPWYKQYEWNIKKAIGGSSLLTAGCHAVDGLRWFLQREAVEVSAYANFSPENPLRYEYEPNSVTIIKFADGVIGKVASLVECVMPYVFNIELFGDQGTIRNNQVFSRRWPGQRSWATIPTVMPDSGDVTHHPFIGEVNHFVECILDGRESHCNIADAVKTHEICLATEISAREGRPVKLPLASAPSG
ncbi:MAG: Gfo/Idh/MocA family protein [Terriglobales bacterium]